MATQVVELTGDEAKLLASLQRVIEKEREHERQLARSGEAGATAGNEIAVAMQRTQSTTDRALKGMLADLRRAGPEGRDMAEALRQHFATTGQAGQRSIETIVDQLRSLDPEAAAAAEAMREEFAGAQVQIQFDSSIDNIRRLGGIAAEVVNDMRETLASIRLVPPDPTAFIAKLREIDPAIADVAESVRARFAAIDPQIQMDRINTVLNSLPADAAQAARDVTAAFAATAGPTLDLDALVGQLQAVSPEAAQVVDRVRAEFASLNPQIQFYAIQAAMSGLPEQSSEVATRIRETLAAADIVDPAAQFAAMTSAIDQLGPQASEIAARVTTELAMVGDDSTGLTKYLADLRALGPAGAAVADQISQKIEEADRKTQFDATLRELRSLGGDAAKIAEGIADDLRAADAAAAGDMTAVLDRLKAIDPTVEQSAERIKQELADAARFGEGKFGETLQTLRSMGPVGKQVADQLKTELVNAGELAERSIEDVISTLERIDPAAADAARKIHANLDDAATRSSTSFAGFAKSAVAQIATVAAGYVGLQEAIGLVNDYLRDQEYILQRALDRQLDLAKSQQEASKNLAALSAFERNELLQNAVPRIAKATGVSDLDAISLALGVASSSGADAKTSEDAVTQAAKLNVFTPEAIGDTAAASVTLLDATGLADVREAVSLIQSAATQMKLVDSRKVAENLPVAVSSAMATVRNQDVQDAARQSAAIFSQVTKEAADTQGESSRTFAIQFTGSLGRFFGDFEDELIDARSKIELIDRKIDGGTATEANIRDRERLSKFVIEGERVQTELSGTDAFETLFGRIETLQRNPALREQFLENAPAETRFKVVQQSLLDASSEASQGLVESFKNIQANVDYFEKEVQQLRTGTPQLVLANSRAMFDAAVAAREAFDIERAALANIRNIVSGAVQQTPQNTVFDFLSRNFQDSFIDRGRLEGSTASEEAVSGIILLERKIREIEADGIITQQEAQDRDYLRSSIEDLVSFLETFEIDRLDTTRLSNARQIAEREAEERRRASTFNTTEAQRESQLRSEALMQRLVEIMERNAAAAEQTQRNTQPRPPDANAAISAAAAAADARAVNP